MSSVTVSPLPIHHDRDRMEESAKKSAMYDADSFRDPSSLQQPLSRREKPVRPMDSASSERTHHHKSKSRAKSKIRPDLPSTNSPTNDKHKHPPSPNLLESNINSNGQVASTSTDVASGSLAPASPRLPYFDKYPKRADRMKSSQNLRDDSAQAEVHLSLPVSTKHSRPNTAPGPRSSLDSTLPSRLRTSKDLDKPKLEDGNMYAWPAKVPSSLHTRRSRARIRQSERSSSSPSPPSSPNSSPNSSPKLSNARELPPLVSPSPYGQFSHHKFPTMHDTPGRNSYTPPQTPSTSHIPDGALVVESGIDVTNMDALVDQINGDRPQSEDLSAFSSSAWNFSRPKRTGGSSHHPLYHPPLPTPPPGIAFSNRSAPKRRPSTTDSYIDNPQSPAAYRSGHAESTNRSYSPTSPPSLSRSSGVSDLSTLSLPRTEPNSYETLHSYRTDDAKASNDYCPVPPKTPPPIKTVVPSITDIIRAHAPEQIKGGKQNLPRLVSKILAPAVSEVEEEPEAIDSRSSMDSIAEEALRAANTRAKSLHHARSMPARMVQSTPSRASSVASPNSPATPSFPHSPQSENQRFDASEFSFGSSTVAAFSPQYQSNSRPSSPTREMAQYLRSPRLTRLITLRKHPNIGVTVSLADVGSSTGHPVILYLGLGCVRYIIGLYDEMAEALNLRLICLDRWGLGRTTDIPSDQRGMREWASVVEEVADTLGLERFSIAAHSAGAPYSLASALRMSDRVFGSIHLLAPWVSMSVDGGYKWLKYIPVGLIKTAQTAEWKMQGWKLGKPPSIAYEGIGFDPNAPVSSQFLSPSSPTRESDSQSRPSFSASEYDDLADFNGQYSSTTTLPNLSEVPPPPPPKSPPSALKKKTSKGSFLGLFEGRQRRQPSISRPPTTRADSMPDSTLPRASNSEAKPLRSQKSKASLKSVKPSSLRSLKTDRGNSLPPLPQAEDIPLRPISPLNFDLTKFEEVSDWDKTVRASSKTTIGRTSEHGVVDRRNGKRAISFSPQPKYGKDTDNTPPLPPLPAFALNFAPPSPTGSSMTQQSRNTGTRNGTSYSTTSAAIAKQSQKPGGITLASALMRASHAEALKGGTADLLSILERADSRPWGFSYTDVKQPVKVWYGDKDDKIGIASVRWMERTMKNCSLKIIKGEGHGLLTNAEVVVDVLESIAQEWRMAS